MTDRLRVFIGWDSREEEAYDVCVSSLRRHASVPLDIVPLKQQDLREQGLYTRPEDKLSSTEFSFTRFLTPYMANFEGWALFVDCDFLYTADVAELFALADETKALMCVQHDYTPKETTKMDGQVQTVYPRKNWSSMVLYNAGHPKNRILTPDVVNSESGMFLHRFMWLEDDLIGDLPYTWNWLEGFYPRPEEGYPKAIHYTRGGPWFKDWQSVDYADLWQAEKCRLQAA
ncbi:MAG: glycosyltransferase [Alphaproteobacteria bacterium]|nr:glycosyltransferase [Alphaproteobacteria bacterium]